MTMTMVCPYCHMGWDVASALEAARILGRHEAECQAIPDGAA